MKVLFFILFFSGNLLNSLSAELLTESVLLTRGIEIRYIQNHPSEQDQIIVDGVKYPVFNSKQEAVIHVENMSIKKDFTIVYVRSAEKKESEIVEIN